VSRRYASPTSCRPAWALLLAGLGACSGGDGAPVAPVPPVVSQVEVTGATATLAPGQTVSLTATPKTAAGQTVSGAAVAWSSAAPAVASVDGGGVVTGVAAGTTEIRATASGVTGRYAVTVTSGAGVLATVQVTVDDAALLLGMYTQARVTGRDFVGGAVALGTRPVTWTTATPTLASVTAAGGVRAIGVGTAIVQVAVQDGAQQRTATATVTVAPIADAPASADVFMPGLTFSPFESVVKVGGAVRFVFPGLPHNVIWTPRFPGSPADIAVTSNTVVTRTFPTPGVYPYTCTLHPGMDGTIIVSP
jgi:plastocyanin